MAGADMPPGARHLLIARGVILATARAMRAFVLDVRLAFRMLRQSPGLAAACIVTLALGIGANTTIYSYADAVLFRPLAVPDADRIVHVVERRQSPGNFPMSFGEYPNYRDHASSFEAVAAHYSASPLHVLIDGTPEALTGAVTTASYFEVVQLRPAIGRFFGAEEDAARDRDAVAVISHALWQRRFGGDVGVLGRPLTINGRIFSVIGVAPAGFSGVQPRGASVDVWMPSAMFGVGYRYCDAFQLDCTIVQLLARLKPGVRIEGAQRETDAIAARYPAELARARQRLGVSVVPARGLGYAASSSERRQLNLLLGAVTLILVITCANIAGLLLARATSRRKQIAVRFAMGASRMRVASLVLAESTVLAVIGGLAALLAATWSTDLLAAVYGHDSAGRPLTFDLSLTWPVAAAAMGLTALAAILVGGLPAWHASRSSVIAVLKDEGASGGSTRARLRQALVTVQVAVSVILIVAAVLLIASGQRAFEGPNFDAEQVITMRVRPSLIAYDRERAHVFQRDLIERLESLAGVISASPSIYMSIFSAGVNTDVTDITRRDLPVTAIANAVGPRYFSTMGTELISGREFSDQDRTGAPEVAIVNEVLAKTLWPDGDAAGMPILLDGRLLTIVGVVRDAQYYVSGDAPRPQIFTSYWQPTGADNLQHDARTFIRVSGEADAMVPAILRAAALADPAVPVSETHSLRERVAYMFQPVRAARLLLTAAAGLALLLCAVGLYGVLAFTVSARTREIGLRVAIGATAPHIGVLVAKDAATVIGAGIAIGLAGAWYATRWVSSLLFGVDAHDSSAFVAAPLVIAVVAALALWLPMRRAMRVSPLTALRVD
jgi:predicted permease